MQEMPQRKTFPRLAPGCLFDNRTLVLASIAVGQYLHYKSAIHTHFNLH